MRRPLVCVLSEGDAPAALAAIQSADAHGLDVAVGVTGQRPRGRFPDGLRVEPVAWRDDFADARNQLAARLDAPWLLWLDSDERLERCDLPDLDGLAAAVYGVRIRDRADLTPRPIARLHRNAPGVAWRGAIHEIVRGGALGDPPILEGVLVAHDGYEDPAMVAAKRLRNRDLVAVARARGADDWILALEEARLAEASGGDAFRAWLAVFSHPDAAPARPGDWDGRVEAAESLAAMGYATPARLLLEANPRIVPLRLALLARAAAEGGASSADVDAAVDLLAAGGDDRYAYPAVLVGADRAALHAWLAARAGGGALSA